MIFSGIDVNAWDSDMQHCQEGERDVFEMRLVSAMLCIARILGNPNVREMFAWETDCAATIAMMMDLQSLIEISPAHYEWMRTFSPSGVSPSMLAMSIRGVQPFLWDEIVAKTSCKPCAEPVFPVEVEMEYT